MLSSASWTVMPPTIPLLPRAHSSSYGRAIAHRHLVLLICSLSLLLVGLDATIVNVALPDMRHSLSAAVPDLQWIVAAYTLVRGSLLLLAGSMADRFGRRRVFGAGLVVFGSG